MTQALQRPLTDAETKNQALISAQLTDVTGPMPSASGQRQELSV